MANVSAVIAAGERTMARPVALVRDYGLTLAIAAIVFLVAYDDGGFGESTRDMLAIALWWAIILGVALGLVPLVRAPLAALVSGGLLGAFALLTLLSVVWAVDAAGAYAEFTRVALYVAVFVLAVLGSARRNVGRWADGLALGIVAVTIVALVSRFYPGTFPDPDLPKFLPAGATRLAFPVGYWNGLAILVALAIPLLLRVAVVARNPAVRALGVTPLPAIAATIYLASSRTGVATALVGTLVFLLLTRRRWPAAAAITVAGTGSVAAILALLSRDELVNGPLDGAAAASQGKSAALIIAGVCVLVGLIYGVGWKAARQAPQPSPIVGWILVAVAVVAAIAIIAAAHPIRRFDQFRDAGSQTTDPRELQSHLLSAAGNGRWQLWQSAVDEFETRPAVGRGAGSYEAWWLQHGSLPLFVKDAHSLYLETLGELGIVGFLLLVSSFIAGVAAALKRLFRSDDADRATAAALIGTFVAFAVAASADWMWELAIVPLVAFTCLGLATGPATALATRLRPVRTGEGLPFRARVAQYGGGIALVVGGWLLICAIAVPFLAGARLEASSKAAAKGNFVAAVRAALDARAIQPWSAEPDLQLALIEERAGEYRKARRSIVRAISHDSVDWRLWLVKSRLEAKLGAVKAAKRSSNRAKALNPRSPLFKV